MPGLLDSLMRRRGVGVLRAAIAERTPDGRVDNAAVVIKVEGKAPVKWSAILSKVTRQMEPDDKMGGLKKVERMTAVGDTATLQAAGVASAPYGAKAVIAGRGDWMIDVDTSEWGPVMTTLGFMRKPLVRKEENTTADG